MSVTAVGGLHHVTAIAGPAQENLDFYAGVLGMRLVKKSVNQDDPGTYHLFYADAVAHGATQRWSRFERRGVACRTSRLARFLGAAAGALRNENRSARAAVRTS